MLALREMMNQAKEGYITCECGHVAEFFNTSSQSFYCNNCKQAECSTCIIENCHGCFLEMKDPVQVKAKTEANIKVELSVEVGCESLPGDLAQRLDVESTLRPSQVQEVEKILTSMLYIARLDAEGL